jgi:hypothetical protein
MATLPKILPSSEGSASVLVGKKAGALGVKVGPLEEKLKPDDGTVDGLPGSNVIAAGLNCPDDFCLV